MLAELFNLEVLQVEDASNPNQRAKFDLDENGALFAVLKVLHYDKTTSDVTTGQVAVFIGTNYAVTIRQRGLRDLVSVQARIEGNDGLREHGPDCALYSVLDTVVDEYLAVIDAVSAEVDQIEKVAGEIVRTTRRYLAARSQ
ncbi:MAG: CorA family divalent cation transporter [Actinomycetales bacterium]